MVNIVWTNYFRYRAERRGFDLNSVESILRFSGERYYDVETNRFIVVGKHKTQLVMIPYERNDIEITPITIHATTRQQIQFRLKTSRFITDV